MKKALFFPIVLLFLTGCGSTSSDAESKTEVATEETVQEAAKAEEPETKSEPKTVASKPANPCDCPYPETPECPLNGLMVFNNLEAGIACATDCHKPLFVWFTSLGARPAQIMDEVMASPSVFPILQNDVVVVVLYTDDETPIEEENQEIWNNFGTEIKVTTVGLRNMKTQKNVFDSNILPSFFLTTSDCKGILAEFNVVKQESVVVESITTGLDKFKQL